MQLAPVQKTPFPLWPAKSAPQTAPKQQVDLFGSAAFWLRLKFAPRVTGSGPSVPGGLALEMDEKCANQMEGFCLGAFERVFFPLSRVSFLPSCDLLVISNLACWLAVLFC